MSFLRKGFLVLAGALPLLAAGVTQAQTTATNRPPALTPEQVAIMRHDMDTALHYKLAPDVLPRLTATLQAIQTAGIQPPARYGMSLDQQIQFVEQVKGLSAILKDHGFTPRDFVMSLTCVGLTGSLMNIPAGQEAGGDLTKPEPQNVALLRANPQALQALASVIRAEKPATASAQ
ncbi:hypothetical protein [Acetobacter vaccinii]|nr:hypothetical protein [Acetobacter vaccinii]